MFLIKNKTPQFLILVFSALVIFIWKINVELSSRIKFNDVSKKYLQDEKIIPVAESQLSNTTKFEITSPLIEKFWDKKNRRSGVYPPIEEIQPYGETWNMLSKMARFANLAYCTTKYVATKEIQRSASVYLDVRTSSLIIFFKGPSYTSKDWREKTLSVTPFKLPFSSHTYQHALIEKSWANEVTSMIPLILPKIKSFLNNPLISKIYFTGHGIGGAYAVIAAMAVLDSPLESNGVKLPEVIVVTFGQPRIGGIIFAEEINKLNLKIFRVTNGSDYVSRLYLDNLHYIHHETEYWINNLGCDCPMSVDGFGEAKNFKVYKCTGAIDGFNAGENPKCNKRQFAVSNEEAERAHLGPYFGITMGNCRKGMNTLSM
ncbi:hypothetical protein G9A89_003822 [Geosiphon pyriformis]|nr:hypothetical protein G9A89_003822 [Geosiphon pyriformis]